MATISASIGSVQRKLDFPSWPDEAVIGEYLIETLDEKMTEMQISREPWFLARCTITVEPNQDEYALDARANDYGKARYVYTKDESDPSFRRAPVPIKPYEDLIGYYHSGEPSISSPITSTLKHSAIACAVFFDSNIGQNKIVFAPIPSQQAQYVLVYEPNTERPGALQDTGFRFPQFDSYISDCTAQRCLRHCKWKGLTVADNKVRRDDLRGDLMLEVQRGDSLFQRFKRSMTNPDDYQAIGFGQSRWGGY